MEGIGGFGVDGRLDVVTCRLSVKAVVRGPICGFC